MRSVFSSLLANDDINTEIVVFDRMAGIDFSYNGIFELISTLKPDRAPGPDGTQHCVLKSCSENIAHYLLVLFSRYLEDGSVLKIGNLKMLCRYTNMVRETMFKTFGLYH